VGPVLVSPRPVTQMGCQTEEIAGPQPNEQARLSVGKRPTMRIIITSARPPTSPIVLG
jgi:hypothetical protein